MPEPIEHPDGVEYPDSNYPATVPRYGEDAPTLLAKPWTVGSSGGGHSYSEQEQRESSSVAKPPPTRGPSPVKLKGRRIGTSGNTSGILRKTLDEVIYWLDSGQVSSLIQLQETVRVKTPITGANPDGRNIRTMLLVDVIRRLVNVPGEGLAWDTIRPALIRAAENYRDTITRWERYNIAADMAQTQAMVDRRSYSLLAGEFDGDEELPEPDGAISFEEFLRMERKQRHREKKRAKKFRPARKPRHTEGMTESSALYDTD